jgi:hypothetical protein
MAAYAAKTKDLLANREIHVCEPAAQKHLSGCARGLHAAKKLL